MNETQNRHWVPRYSLRGLLVGVALLALTLTYYIRWKEARREARAWIKTQGVGGSIGYHPEPHPGLPWGLRLLGEESEQTIVMSNRSTSLGGPPSVEYKWLLTRMEQLFPEAQIVDATFYDEDDEK